MSIQDDINYVKKELSADEKVLESALKIETIYKKYKNLIWGAVGVSIVAFGATTAMSAIKEAKLESANSALLTLQADANSTTALSILKENNPKLLELYNYSMAIKAKDSDKLNSLSSSQNSILADISKYHIAVLADKPTSSEYYKDLSLVEMAYGDIKSGDNKSAKSKLEMVDARSSLASVAQLLNHYTIKGKGE
jgi:hypothetical protein